MYKQLLIGQDPLRIEHLWRLMYNDYRMPGLVKQPFQFVDGFIEVPETPGMGIELNEQAFAGKPLESWHRRVVVEPDGNIEFQ